MPTQEECNFQEFRKKMLGGSDSPVIILDKQHPFSDIEHLYLEKIGETPAKPETAPMKRGKMMEPIIAQLYEEKTGRKLEIVEKALIHPDFDFIGGHIDRKVTDDKRGEGVAEFKYFNLKNFYQAKRDGIPDYIQIQAQHYMGLGFPWASIAIFNAEAWDPIIFDIERDDDLVNHIYNECAKFWEHVKNRVPPTPSDIREDIDLPKEKGTIIRMDTPEWEEAVRELREAEELSSEVVQVVKTAKDRLILIMDEQGIECAEGAGARIYWRNQAGRKTFDKEALKKDHPSIDFSKYEKSGNPFKQFRSYFTKKEW